MREDDPGNRRGIVRIVASSALPGVWREAEMEGR
jgi:hypothetical protein